MRRFSPTVSLPLLVPVPSLLSMSTSPLETRKDTLYEIDWQRLTAVQRYGAW